MAEYIKPADVGEALKAGLQQNSAYVGGGINLTGNQNELPDLLISLENLDFGGINKTADALIIGSTVRLQELLDYPGIPTAFVSAAGYTASRTLRNMQTVAGEVLSGDPGSCLLPVLAVLDAEIIIAGQDGNLPASDFLEKQNRRILIEKLRIPQPNRMCLVRSVSRTSHSKKQLVVAVAAYLADGIFKDVHIIISDGVGNPQRLSNAETTLDGAAHPGKAEIEKLVQEEFDPSADFSASAPYKSYLAGTITADLLYELSDREGN